ncbi:MAG: DNA-protecting protein DprA [Phycisphaeraceae bacterium]|nr:DNA-protecting protein DprA [Phycisphaeraceae bacterium]
MGPKRTLRSIQQLGSAQAVVGASAQQLAQVEGIGRKVADDVCRGLDELRRNRAVEEENELLAQTGVTLAIYGQEGYPKLLTHIHDPPPLLYVKGTLKAEDSLALAVVGSRRCSNYGRSQADRLAGLCAGVGLTIVSGGAYGIDAAAHRGALRNGGRTIAVMGSGLLNPYPQDHAELYDQIAGSGGAAEEAGAGERRGALISELPMRSPPLRDNFPARNRIISGLSLGVLVVEAALRSGALITARLAAEEHHREVMALPGRVDSTTSAGCHLMIREGWAHLATNLEDILASLGETGRMLQGAIGKKGPTGDDGQSYPPAEPGADTEQGPVGSHANLFEQGLTESARKIIAALRAERSADDATDVDDLAIATGLPVAVVRAELTMLEIRGLVKRQAGGFVGKR